MTAQKADKSLFDACKRFLEEHRVISKNYEREFDAYHDFWCAIWDAESNAEHTTDADRNALHQHKEVMGRFLSEVGKVANEIAPEADGWQKKWYEPDDGNGWEDPIWVAAIEASEATWKLKENVDVVETRAAQQLAALIQELLEEYQTDRFIACIPMERVFERFPEFSDFGEFQIVNVSQHAKQGANVVVREFRRVLAENVGVNFVDTSENYDNYDSAAKELFRASKCYFPGRPQMIVDVGAGGSPYLLHALRNELAKVLPLLRTVQLYYEYKQTSGWADDGWRCEVLPASTQSQFDFHPVMPDGTSPMPVRRMEVPLLAAFINVNSGVPLWRSPTDLAYRPPAWFIEMPKLSFGESGPLLEGTILEEIELKFRPMRGARELLRGPLESADVPPYDFDEFLVAWKNFAMPIMRFRTLAKNKRFNGMDDISNAVDHVIEMLSLCLRNSSLLPLHSVVALETLLGPWIGKGEITQRLALFAAAFLPNSTHLADKLELCNTVKDLYGIRSTIVHGSALFPRDDNGDKPSKADKLAKERKETALRRKAFGIFVRVMQPIMNWAIEVLETRESFTVDDRRRFMLIRLLANKSDLG